MQRNTNETKLIQFWDVQQSAQVIDNAPMFPWAVILSKQSASIRKQKKLQNVYLNQWPDMSLHSILSLTSNWYADNQSTFTDPDAASPESAHIITKFSAQTWLNVTRFKKSNITTETQYCLLFLEDVEEHFPHWVQSNTSHKLSRKNLFD